MLAHSPPLPLTIFYTGSDGEMTAEDEEGVLLALSHRDRVRHIHLELPASTLRKFVLAMDEEFPMLERMYVACRSDEPTNLVFPGTFQAPNLRHLLLQMASLPIGSPYSQLPPALSLSDLDKSRHPPTYPRIVSLPGFRLCSSWRSS
jgi:hypothetical protein